MSVPVLLVVLVQFRRLIAAQTIVDRLEQSNTCSELYILDDASILSLNGVSFRNDNVKRLMFDGKSGMKLRSVSGVKRWPKQLKEVWINNMQNFRVSSLNDVPDQVMCLGLKRNVFDSVSEGKIRLPQNLKCLSITHCKISHEVLNHLDLASLSKLIALDLACLDHMDIIQYSDKNPIFFPTATLASLCIDYRLMENILTHQEPQQMKKLTNVLIRMPKTQRVDTKHIAQMTRLYKYFGVYEKLRLKINDRKLRQ